MEILRNIQVPTGNICIMLGDKGRLEFLSIGDYGKQANIKADFLGIERELNGVPNGDIMPLTEKWVVTVSTQYGCSMNCKFCLLENAPILMSDYTTKKISEIELGDSVICNINPKENSNSPIKQYASTTTTEGIVTGLIKRNYKGKLYTIKTESGKVIKCTEGHPIASKYKSRSLYKKSNEISVGDEIITCIGGMQERNDEWEIGWVYGFTEGDGCYDEIDIKRWMISQNDKEMLIFLSDVLSKNGIKTSNIWNNSENNYRIAIQGKNVDLLNKLIKLKEKSKDFMIGYVAGFWDAEGLSFLNNQSVRVCNTNISLIDKVVRYINILGYNYTSIYTSKHKKYKDCYTLNIQISRDKFINVFMPLHNKKNFLNNKISRGFCHFEKVVSVNTKEYSGIVYNIETSEHCYYAYNILNHNCDVPKVGPGINATLDDLDNEVISALKLHSEITSTNRLNIHYARMGEPTWNFNVLLNATNLPILVKPYIGDSLIHPVISTMMPKENKKLFEFLYNWCSIKNVLYKGNAGLQFSINSTDDAQREYLFSGNALSLKEISEMAKRLPMPKGRKYALNFALADNSVIDERVLINLFPADKFMCKITPLHDTKSCEENDLKTTGGYRSFTPYKDVETRLKSVGYDVIVFIPSYDEDHGLITCGNAILSGNMPTSEYKEIK